MIGISDKTYKLYLEALENLGDEFKKIDDIRMYNTNKVLNAFWNNNVCETDFNSTTGYGYNDQGRDTIEKVYAEIFKSESALVRNQIISGSHALAKTLFGLLRPGDLLLAISGTPYDTLHEVIGIKENKSSLKSFGVKYDEIDLVNNDFDYERIKDYLLNNKVKVIHIQRSRGYSTRDAIDINKVEKVCKLIKDVSSESIIMVDNCYCELVTTKEPIEVGADICVGSLIKNLGAGIAPNGGYVVGKKKLVELVAEALTLPGEGSEVGPTLGANKSFLQGLFLAPQVVTNALKIGIVTSYMMEKLGYKVSPKYNDSRTDIVTTIEFGNSKDLIDFCTGIQSGSPVDSNALTIPVDMPGYDNKVIMAAGAFTQGSSIELSCDGPIREPYIAYLQGGLTYESGVIGVLKAIDKIIRKEE